MMVLAFIFAAALAAAPAQPTSTLPSSTAAAPPAAVDETAPVPVPEPSEKALQYYRSGNLLWVVDIVWSLAILVVPLATGFSASLRSWALRAGRKWFFALVLYYLVLNLIITAVDLPPLTEAGTWKEVWVNNWRRCPRPIPRG